MVALFVACALVPLAATMLIAYRSVHELLVAQRVGFLHGQATGYGTSLIERLNVADTLARAIGNDLAVTRDLKHVQGLDAYFRGGAILEASGTRRLFGQPSRVPSDAELAPIWGRLASGAPQIVLVRTPKAPTGVWFVQQATSPSGARWLALELHPGFLWSDDQLPYLTDVCVFATDGEALNCSRSLSRFARERMPHGKSRSNGDFAWQEDGERFLSGYREVFLRARFGAEPWVVVASQPAAHALAPVHALGWLVLPLVLLGLLVAALLGLIQVRRALQPLKELTEATERVAKGDFSARLPAARDDEFGALGDAFNTMSDRLGRQFEAMRAHSEINAVILSSMDLAHVATIALKRVAELVPAARCWLLLPKSRSAGRFTMFRSGDETVDKRPTIVIAEPERERLMAAAGGVTSLQGLPEPHLFALPIMLGSKFGGALVLAYDTPRQPNEEEVALLLGLADRVAVALATARRDEELYRRANFDSLTGLPNRLLGADALSRAVAAAARDRSILAVLFIDLDGFAAVNDSAGHAAGDRLLAQTAARLRECVRKSDIVARLGGDEFAVVLTELREAPDAVLAARSIIETLSKPDSLREAGVSVSASVGIAIYPNDGSSAEELLRHADLAMYKAKQSGRRQFAFFEASMNEEVLRRAQLATDLRRALEQGQFELHYQPQLEVRSGRIVGAEALLRWVHPVRGSVPPGDFIAFAESSGFIEEIGRWALDAASAQLVAWRRAGLQLDRVSVNVSARQLQKPGFDQVVAEALRRAGMSAADLSLELTEGAVLDNTGAADANLAALAAMGVTLELDDFGTGYSALAYLQRLPVATVKLDRTFIGTIQTSSGTQAVVKAAIDMVHALGKTVLAEGVEHKGEMDVLARMGCDLMQGYLLSAALPAAEFSRFVAARQAAPASENQRRIGLFAAAAR
jgi:diguanylate cyclase (GGDEF)-like protein